VRHAVVMSVTATLSRLTSALLVSGSLLLAFAGFAYSRPDGIRFTGGAHRVVQGNEMAVTLSVSPAGCAAARACATRAARPRTSPP
jgi:hypothetical protein